MCLLDVNFGCNDFDQIVMFGLFGNVMFVGMQYVIYVGGEYEWQCSFCGDMICGKVMMGFNFYDFVYGLFVLGGVLNLKQSDLCLVVYVYLMIVQDLVKIIDCFIVVGGLCWENWQQELGMGWLFVFVDCLCGSVWLLQFGFVYVFMLVFIVYVNVSCLFKLNVVLNVVVLFVLEYGCVFEVGLKFSLKFVIMGMFVVYQIDKCNVVVMVDDIMLMIGIVCLCGIEFDVVGQIMCYLSVIGSYVYMNVNDCDSNMLFVNVVCYMGSLFVVYDMVIVNLFGCWCFGGGVCFVGVCFGDIVNSFMLFGYVSVDVFVVYEMMIGKFLICFQFNVKNLFDKIYYLLSNNNLIVVVGELWFVMLMMMVLF